MKKIIFIFCIYFSSLFGTVESYQVGFDIFSGESHEIVYTTNSNHKLSELIYTTNNALLLSGGLEYRLKQNYLLKFKFKTLVQENETNFDDYDWIDESNSNWTHWSQHPNTNLDAFYMFDVAISKNIYTTKYIQYNFSFYYVRGRNWISI